MKALGRKQAPQNACYFNIDPDVINLTGGNTDKKGFAITGYSGGIIRDHWWWGNLAFDLQGLKFAKKRTPVLEEHMIDRKIGIANQQKITDKVTFTGDFLNTDEAVKLQQTMADGFPMEASLSLRPHNVEYVKEGATTKVNGHTLKGPGTVIRKGTIKEVSMCVFGADSNTSSTAMSADNDSVYEFDLDERIITMKTETAIEMSKDKVKTEFASVYQEIFEDGKQQGVNSEIERFNALQNAVGDDPALLVECFAQGKDVTFALTERNKKLQSENEKLRKGNTRTETTETTEKVDPAETEFTDNQEAVKRGQQPDNDTQVKEWSGINAGDPEAVKAAFTADESAQSQFTDHESFGAYLRAAQQGRVKIQGHDAL